MPDYRIDLKNMRCFTVRESGICIQCGKGTLVCSIRDRDKPEHKTVNMAPQPPLR